MSCGTPSSAILSRLPRILGNPSPQGTGSPRLSVPPVELRREHGLYDLRVDRRKNLSVAFYTLSTLLDKYGAKPIHLHTSSHCAWSDIEGFVEKLRPGRVAPIHTEHAERFVERLPNVCLVE